MHAPKITTHMDTQSLKRLQNIATDLLTATDDELRYLVSLLSSDYDATYQQLSTMSTMIYAFNTPVSKQTVPLRYRPELFPVVDKA